MTDSARPMIDNALLTALRYTHQITPATNVRFCMEQEQHSLYRLRQRLLDTAAPLSLSQAYLTLYDCLFRHVSMALLNQGYQLTAKQPHQTLRRIIRQSAPDLEVQHMIAQRHTLKKTTSTVVCKDAAATLIKVLGDYARQDSQACQIPTPLVLQRIVMSSTIHQTP